ncbi:aldehyde dehydrogenase family protein [candidate division KSB1 bacterium]|nr:aldehyde dehydrogenase family protein [candidate division KSB1 bacterium]
MRMNETRCMNPATAQEIGRVAETCRKEWDSILRNAHSAQSEWSGLDLKQRIKILRDVLMVLVERKHEIAELINKDNGKPRVDAMATEVLPAAMALDYYCRHARVFLKDRSVGRGNILLFNKSSRIVWEPFGVVGIISPWNYPFSIPFSEVVMALLAGNTVILKTASDTQLVGQTLADCFRAVDLPSGVFNFVNIPGRQAGQWFLEGGVNKLFFTGSVPVGKKLMAMAAEHLVPLVLELGGNDAMIVDRDADLFRAARGAVWAGLQNGGQSCGGVERIYVHKDVYDDYLSMLAEYVKEMNIGPDTDFTIDMGPMTNESQLHIVHDHVNKALKQGARIAAQGKMSPEAKKQGWFFPPTVLVDVNHGMKVMREETFGPVLAVMPVTDLEQAVQLANDSEFGLTASIWTRNRSLADRIALKLAAGVVTVNDHLMSHGLPETPWGGYKQSGIGRTHGELGFKEMVQSKVIVHDFMPFCKKNMWWPPYSKKLYDGLAGTMDFLYGKQGNRFKGIKKLLKIVPRYFREN